MTDRGWYGDSEYCDALQRSQRATRLGWTAIAGATGAVGCALTVVVGLCVAAFVAGMYVVIATDH
ncbi:hypothetical protein E2C00_01045 [Streptomyces sp. WAC05374]|nr:hypothetical protein EF905_12625 [Streptomyces sp. WAC05374]TDF50133.1 hypothetical protein E2B92_01020 [Streptomyces sp. WAC05374]TDF57858.1 hypothetical protein E2C02_08810 [Streptomyces sp. WAC05374]TDF60387.1 hypothetical protein E2C00_01045 [Streptomyces sp. WAC05374]